MPLPSWLSNPDAGLLNKASWRISALLAGTIALVAVYLNQGKILPEDAAPQPAPAVVAHPAPPVGVDHDREPATVFEQREAGEAEDEPAETRMGDDRAENVGARRQAADSDTSPRRVPDRVTSVPDGQTVLIHGASGGVGLAACDLAKALEKLT